MRWYLLITAIVLEVAGTTCMKLSNGMSRLWPTLAMFALYAASLGALSLALKAFDISVAYAIWGGVGTALVAAIGLMVFHEPMSWAKAGGLILVVAGIVLLNLAAGEH